MLREKQQMIETYFERYGLPVETRFTRGGVSVHTKARKTPITRYVPAGKGDVVEVMWYSHRDRWEHIGDFGGVTMSLAKALEYVVTDAPGCFHIDLLRSEGR